MRMRDVCWGYLCLHREAAHAVVSRDEAQFVQRIAPHLAEGLRTGLLRQACDLRLRRRSATGMPRLRVRTRSGRWAVLHASWTNFRGDNAITVILEDAAPAEVAPVIDKTGVHSRGELVATILRRDYLPRAMSGDPLSRSDGFAAG